MSVRRLQELDVEEKLELERMSDQHLKLADQRHQSTCWPQSLAKEQGLERWAVADSLRPRSRDAGPATVFNEHLITS